MVKSMGFDLRGVIHFCRSNVVGLRLLFLACRLHVFMTDHHDCSRSCVHVCTYTSSILLVSVSTVYLPYVLLRLRSTLWATLACPVGKIQSVYADSVCRWSAFREGEEVWRRLLCVVWCVGARARLNLCYIFCVIHRHGSTKIDNNNSIVSIQFEMRVAIKSRRNIVDQRIGFAVDDKHAGYRPLFSYWHIGIDRTLIEVCLEIPRLT